MSWICGRVLRSSLSAEWARFLPSNQMFPDVGASRQAIQDASVLLPEPDSPTIARVEREETAKETPSRARKSCGGPTRVRFA